MFLKARVSTAAIRVAREPNKISSGEKLKRFESSEDRIEDLKDGLNL